MSKALKTVGDFLINGRHDSFRQLEDLLVKSGIMLGPDSVDGGLNH